MLDQRIPRRVQLFFDKPVCGCTHEPERAEELVHWRFDGRACRVAVHERQAANAVAERGHPGCGDVHVQVSEWVSKQNSRQQSH